MTTADRMRTSRRLVDVAMGRAPADLVVRGGRWVCVQSGEIVPATDIAVVDGRIAYVGPDAQHTVGPATQVIEAFDRWLVPGLLDGHMHVEFGMLTVTEFVWAVMPRGTTGMFIDPARDRQRARAGGRAPDGAGSRRAADPRLGAGSILCPLGSRAGDTGRYVWTGRGGRSADVAERDRSGRGDELSGRFGQRREDARRDGGGPSRGEGHRRTLPVARSGPALPCLCRRRPRGRSRRHAPGGCRRPRPSGDEGHAAPGFGLA